MKEPFDPTKQWGNYILINEPDSTDEAIAEAKSVLQEQINSFVPEEYRDTICWIINKRDAVFDEHGNYVQEWKTTPRSKV